jgi:hypothetical protein
MGSNEEAYTDSGRGAEKPICQKCGALCGEKARIWEIEKARGDKRDVKEFRLCEACTKSLLRSMKSVQQVDLDFEAISKLKNPDHVPEYRIYKYLNDIEE